MVAHISDIIRVTYASVHMIQTLILFAVNLLYPLLYDVVPVYQNAINLLMWDTP